MSNTAVFGVYRDTASLSGGLEALRAAGFRNTDISVLLPENAGTKDFVHQKDSKAPEGAAAGATTGAVLGGIVGWLAGIGALAIPGIGPLIAAGPIVALHAGAGAVGTAGATGGTLISVHCDNSEWVKRAKKLLEDTGAEDIASSGEAKADYATSERPGSRV